MMQGGLTISVTSPSIGEEQPSFIVFLA